jgi:hypothetical protein
MATGVAIGGLIVGGAQLGLGIASYFEQKDQAQKQFNYNKVKDLTQMNGQMAEYALGIEESQAQIASYDQWLGGYQSTYDAQMAAQNAQTSALKASGQDAYNNFINAIGYSDALAGASGRVGGDTSAGAVTQAADRKLVEYVGEDRTLDGYGGLFGEQLQLANIQTDQARQDLELQRSEVEQNKDISKRAIKKYRSAITRTSEAFALLNEM